MVGDELGGWLRWTLIKKILYFTGRISAKVYFYKSVKNIMSGFSI